MPLLCFNSEGKFVSVFFQCGQIMQYCKVLSFKVLSIYQHIYPNVDPRDSNLNLSCRLTIADAKQMFILVTEFETKSNLENISAEKVVF